MIAAFSRNFVFIRTRKTASTSTEIVLGSWCDELDIVTPVGVEDELMRLDYGGSPRNFCLDSSLEAEYRATIQTRDARAIAVIYRRVMEKLDFHHHMGASELISRLPADFWDRAFKFSVDRHPYDKVVSLAYWRGRKLIEKGASINDLLDEVVEKGEYRNFDLYSVDGSVVVDRVFRYENLWSELSALAEQVGGAIPARPPKAKSRYRRDRQPAGNLLSQQQKHRVYDICREEFALLGYER